MSAPRIPRRFKQAQESNANVVMGVVWYTEAEWALVKAAATDPDVFEPSYKAWLAMAEGGLRDLKKAGISPQKVFVKANELLAWCLTHNKENNAEARTEYVSEQLRFQNERGA
jgi:hypothetical protein